MKDKADMSDSKKILRVDSSMRHSGSTSREASDLVVDKLAGDVTVRDLATTDISFVNEAWIGANFTQDEARTDEQRQVLAASDAFIEELKAADILVLGVPMYNFAAPAAFKAWVDLIARARVTFKYTDKGPVGLLEGKKAYVIVTSGGTKIGSEADYLSGYLRHILKFIGITDVQLLEAKDVISDPAGSLDHII